MKHKRRNDVGRRSGRLAPRSTDGIASPLEGLERRVLMATYYVAPGGSDAAVGSLEQPLGTIQQAADRAAAGDTVLIRGGVYRETVTLPRSGSAGAPITLRPFNN